MKYFYFQHAPTCMIDWCQVDINVCAEQTWRRRCDVMFQVQFASVALPLINCLIFWSWSLPKTALPG